LNGGSRGSTIFAVSRKINDNGQILAQIKLAAKEPKKKNVRTNYGEPKSPWEAFVVKLKGQLGKLL